MIKTNCSKCGADLILHDGYGVCSQCGEIIGFDIDEEPEEITQEITEEIEEKVTEESVVPQEEEIVAEPTEEYVTEEENPTIEVSGFNTEEVFDEISEEDTSEDVAEEVEETDIQEPEEVKESLEEKESETEEIEEKTFADEEIKIPKRRKTPIVILIVLILCALAVLGGYFISKVNQGTVDTDVENVIPEIDVVEEVEEEPKAVNEIPEEEITEIVEEPEPEPAEEPEKKEETAPAPVEKETPKKEETVKKKETVKKEDAAISQTDPVMYRIRKSAGDSTTQIGAFSDLERAKAFATSHAADGYKVYDMYGNIVFEP